MPQSSIPPSLAKEVRRVKLPNMPVGAVSNAATIHNSKVYIRATCRDENDKYISSLLVFSTSERKWRTLPKQQRGAAIAVVNNRITLIGGRDVATGKATNMLTIWYEDEGQWKQTLPPMPTRRASAAVISHDNLLLVTGGVGEDSSTPLNTTDVLDLTTMKWTTPEELNLPVPLWRHNVTLCGEHLYLVAGIQVSSWQSSDDFNSQAWKANWSNVKQVVVTPQHSQPRMGVWTQISDPPILYPTAVSCGGTLYAVGGRTRDNKPVSTIHAYITATNQWLSVGDMGVSRTAHCAVPLNSNTIFVAGGQIMNEGKWTHSLFTEFLRLL